MVIKLLDDTLFVIIKYCPEDMDLEDNICISIREVCPDEERLFRADETNIALTPVQAKKIGVALLRAVDQSLADSETSVSNE